MSVVKQYLYDAVFFLNTTYFLIFWILLFNMKQNTSYRVIISVAKLNKMNQFWKHIASRFNLLWTARSNPRDGCLICVYRHKYPLVITGAPGSTNPDRHWSNSKYAQTTFLEVSRSQTKERYYPFNHRYGWSLRFGFGYAHQKQLWVFKLSI